MIDMIIMCAFFGAFILVSFILGLHYGSKIKKNELIEMPNLNPIKVIKKKVIDTNAMQEEREKQERISIMLSNIDKYDGTPLGQSDLPN